MKKWLSKANAMNPHAKKVCGFQSPFEADFDSMKVVLQDYRDADVFDLIYDNKEVIVYEYRNLLNDSSIKFWDIKYIAQLIGYEAWLVVSGLIAVNRNSQLDYQIRLAKMSLIAAIENIWGVSLKKKEVNYAEICKN